MTTAPEALDAPAEGARALAAPSALLLDFGGVVVTTTHRAHWARELAGWIVERTRSLGCDLDPEGVEQSLRAGRRALSLWKDAASRRLEPRELTSSEIVGDFLLADLPAPIRAAVRLEAGELLERMAGLVADHRVREGIPALLETARCGGVRLGIVSNAHSGRAHRRILDQLGLSDAFGVQVYSDEVGIRKPHPGMIRRAAEALGIDPGSAWYVGDTLDRDVAAGRRAGVGAVMITRDRRTDTPPFPVLDVPDLVVEEPSGLIAPLRTALGTGRASTPIDGAPAPAGPPPPAPRRRPALLLDHGGVITSSTPNPERFSGVGSRIVELARGAGCHLELPTVLDALETGWERHRAHKRRRDSSPDPAHRHEEIDPAELWADLIGQDLPEQLRPLLRLEAAELSLALHRAKSHPAPRPGALTLIEWCRQRGIVVGIVSNTISGRGVREILEDYGISAHIGPAAYSDEIGVRKPGRAIFEAALEALPSDRADVVYVGDKALNDGRGGRDAGIGTVCLLRGGKDSDATLEAALAEGLADHVLDSPDQVIEVLAALAPGRP
ncbi:MULTISPECIES: HAD family hydrolase [unclassified Brachybacterium]|uniref:HAD family hydrolase n=1 Tax=unclassified Brachybacterium TaxID=2623841 RepID=UPI00361EF284